MLMKRMKRCKATGNLFYPRRENQKFENNKARCNFYNKKYRKMYSEIIKTNKLMFVNYKILNKLIGFRNYIEIEKKILNRLHYNFSLTTGIEDEDGLKSFLLYNFKLTFITTEKISIEKL